MLRVVVFNHSYFGFKTGHGTFDANVERPVRALCSLDSEASPLTSTGARAKPLTSSHQEFLACRSKPILSPSLATILAATPTEKSADVEKASNSVLAKSSSKSFTLGGEKYWKELVFLVNVREGFTHRLATIGADKGTVKVFVDGPYGPSPDLSSFNTSVFVAGRYIQSECVFVFTHCWILGGTGVSYTLPLLLDTIE